MADKSADSPSAWYLHDDDTATVYLCGVDWQHELLMVSSGTTVYPTVEDIQEALKCTDQCGIVEVEIRFKRWILPQNIGHKNEMG